MLRNYQFVSAEKIQEPEENELPLQRKNIILGLKGVDKFEAIRKAGELLVQGGYVEKEYIEAMIQRENDITTSRDTFL